MHKIVNGEQVEMSAEEIAEFEASRAVDINQVRKILLKKVDEDVDSIMRDCIGQRATEYQRAETQARAYKAANYTGAVPSTVAAWADAKSWTANQAADDIITQADAWIGAQDAIRENRLKTKEAYRVATNSTQFDAITGTWRGFVNAIRTALGI